MSETEGCLQQVERRELLDDVDRCAWTDQAEGSEDSYFPIKDLEEERRSSLDTSWCPCKPVNMCVQSLHAGKGKAQGERMVGAVVT